MPPSPALASVSVDKIANAFIAWAESEPGRFWWWPRDIRLDPDEVIADDGEGNTYRVPFTTDGELDVTFGDPVEVRETFVDVAAPAAAAAAASARVRQRVLARDLPKPRKTDPRAASGTPSTTQEVDMPDLTPEQFQRLRGLPEDATQEQINAALTGETPAQPAPPAQPDPNQPAPTDPQPADPAQPVQPDPAQPAAPDQPAQPTQPAPPEQPAPPAATADTVNVSRQVWEQTTQRLNALERRDRDRETAEATARRDNAVATWVRDGRITPAERDHYRKLLDLDEDGTTALATSLQAGRVPLAERGHDNDTATTGDQAATTGWFAQLTAKES